MRIVRKMPSAFQGLQAEINTFAKKFIIYIKNDKLFDIIPILTAINNKYGCMDNCNQSRLKTQRRAEMNQTANRAKISITGDLGSGKSTVCRYLKEKFGLKVYSIGQIQRSMAEKYNMDTYAFNKYMEKHPEIDEEIDTELEKIGRRDEAMVLDSRMAWHFVPDSFKVFLSVDPDEAAKRVMKDYRGDVEAYSSTEEAKIRLIERKQSENLRYMVKYGVDCSNPLNYDMIIDSTNLSPEQVAETIIAKLESSRK